MLRHFTFREAGEVRRSAQRHLAASVLRQRLLDTARAQTEFKQVGDEFLTGASFKIGGA